MILITSACSSNVPWEKFSRALSMPAMKSWSRTWGSLEAGPIVAMIFVLRNLHQLRVSAQPSKPPFKIASVRDRLFPAFMSQHHER